MTKNRDSAKQVESQPDSGESEDEEVSSDESDSQESDSEQPQTAAQTKSQPQPAVKPLPPPFSSDEEESETESESDEPDSNARPPSSKPIEKAQKSTDPIRVARSKPSRREPVTPTKSAVAKRPSEDTSGKDAKKAKKTAETPEKKSNLFQRLWSEEDEIVILKGIIDYAAKNKSDPLSDLNAFHDFIKNNLHLDFSRTQLQDKIRRLKKKYRNNKSKDEEGKERSFSKSHEQSVYDLSEEIWGKESGKEKVVGSSKANCIVAKKTPKKGDGVERGEIKGVKNGIGEREKSLQNLNCGYTGGSIEERMFQSGREMYEVGEGVEVEEEWKRLKVEELELYQKQLEVRIAQTKLVLNGMKARDH